ncbi:MAG: hypothetical protein RL172_492 [Bacteroidota bacterium]
MQKTILYIFYTVILHLSLPALAQEPGVVKFANGHFNTGSNISNQQFNQQQLQPALYQNRYYVLVQFNSLPNKFTRQQLQKAGIELGDYFPGNAFLAAIPADFNFKLASQYHINAINLLPALYKTDRRLQQLSVTDSSKDKAFAVCFFATLPRQQVQQALQQAGAVLRYHKFAQGNIIYIQPNKAIINQIASLPFVNSISLQYTKDQPLNYSSRALHGVSALSSPAGKNLQGNGVSVGVGDNADISTHIDFAGRLINRTPWIPDVHGTHTAGTTAGAGIINVKNQGMAPKSTVINQFFSDIIFNAPAYLQDYNMILSNNSYHSSGNGCTGNGDYDVLSNYIDKQLADNTSMLHVFASGNDGSSTCSPLPQSFGTVKSGWQVAKNVLTVGAVDAASNSIAGFSSRGPVADGRIKPEIVSHGVGVLSTYPNNSYGYGVGTSMAAPGVTGTLALLYQRYRQLHSGADPSGALIKAIACNTAEDLGNAGPDYTYGFGVINARRAVDALENNRYFIGNVVNGGNSTHNISIPANTRRIKILLYWLDEPANVTAGNALVNDLDMIVIEPNFTLHRPLTLNAAQVTNTAVETPDHLNNIEQSMIENPAAGTYTINVNGFNIPSGTQQYIVSYELLPAGVTVEYPYGGEKWVPGETETIRWSAYGNEANNFTIEYTTDNGTNWTVIDNNVSAAARLYNWAVPATVTNAAKIRVSRNNTALNGTSQYAFTILGQPALAASNVCEGAVQLSWGSISGATAYEILQLQADSMQVIGTATTTNYLVTGLQKNTRYWFAVAAKNNGSSGRRSVAVNTIPISGDCSMAAFTSDLKVDSILEPTTARQLFSNASNATRPVKVSIKNLSTAAVAGPFDVSYSYGGTVITETINSNINAGAVLQYSFTGTYPKPAAGYQYAFKAWVTKAGDANHLNDTAYKIVKYINNDTITSLPITEGFETMPAAEYNTAEMAIGGNKFIDFTSNSSRGRARTFVNSGMMLGGNRALTLDQFPAGGAANTDSIILNYNLAAFANSQLRFDFYYRNHGQADAAGNKIWIRGSEQNNWIEAYNLFANQGAIGEWKKGIININDVLAAAAQSLTATFQIKMAQEGFTSVNAVDPVVDLDDGYTFDELRISQAQNDVALLAVNSPDPGGCGLTNLHMVSIRIKNYNNTVVTNVQVNYRVNGGAIITENIPGIAPNQTMDYVFLQKANLAAFTDYNFDVWLNHGPDNYKANDSILNYSIHNSPVISNYPYLESFENGDGGFYSKGTNSSWQLGTPAKSIINKAANGSNAWVTNLTGTYNNNETSYLISPCFDLTGMRSPVLSFSHIFEVEKDYDYTWVEYSTDGKTWQKLGTTSAGTNWYDNVLLNNWAISKPSWHVASFDIPVTNTVIKLRFVMSSDAGVTEDGIGIDDVHIHEKALIAGSPAPLTPIASSGPWADGWVPLGLGDSINGPWYLAGQINTHGQSIGQLTLSQYLNTGAVRNSANAYYLDKSYTLQAANSPSGPVSVRLYFSEAQVNDLLNATSCPGCDKPADAYELGITRYKGAPTEEDGTLDNNMDGLYQFIPPANTSIIPFGMGYYAEFSVNNWGEFWLGKANITPAASSNCPGSSISFKATTGAAAYQWQLNTGNGYTNITDGVNYSGTTTHTLQLINVPTSFTGYKYRCIVDVAPGIEYTLRFKNIWNGATSSNWFTATNWSCGLVPDQYTDVIIPTGLANYPVLTGSTQVRSIRMQANAPIQVNTGVQLIITAK